MDRFAANNNVIAMVGRLNERIAQMKSELQNNLNDYKWNTLKLTLPHLIWYKSHSDNPDIDLIQAFIETLKVV